MALTIVSPAIVTPATDVVLPIVTVTGTGFTYTGTTLPAVSIFATFIDRTYPDTPIQVDAPIFDVVIANTTITFKLPNDALPGDYVVTVSSATAASVVSAAFAIAGTDTEDYMGTAGLGDISLGLVQSVLYDNYLLGLMEGELSIAPKETKVPIKPNSRKSILAHLISESTVEISFNLMQINQSTLAIALGGTFTGGTMTGHITNSLRTRKSLVVTDEDGFVYTFPSVEMTDPASISLNDKNVRTLAVKFTAYPVDNGTPNGGTIYTISVPQG